MDPEPMDFATNPARNPVYLQRQVDSETDYLRRTHRHIDRLTWALRSILGAAALTLATDVGERFFGFGAALPEPLLTAGIVSFLLIVSIVLAEARRWKERSARVASGNIVELKQGLGECIIE